MFNPKKDKIAITIPEFKLNKSADFGRYNEPYIVSVAVDSSGKKLNVGFEAFPKVTPGSSIKMLGEGLLIYGPENPGEFVSISLLVMEADGDVRDLGTRIDQIVSSQLTALSLQTIIRANPSASGTLGILKELTQFIAGALKNNKDDELFRIEGTFLRDASPTRPYHINTIYKYESEYVDLSLKIIPLKESSHNTRTFDL